jgi:FkbM family methyltransferase
MKILAKRIIRNLGYELRRYTPTTSGSAQLMAILKHHNVNLVFDVGANIGNFGISLREGGYRGRIVSFEPMKAAYEAVRAAARNDPLWQVATRAAIGEEHGEAEIHIAANSESSSILEMLAAHSAAAPEANYIGTEKVPLRRLDSLAPEYIQTDSVLFLKIDTQGYEDKVLSGARETLSRAVVLQLELSLIYLYAGQKLMIEMLTILEKMDFELWGMAPVFADPRSGRMLQVDAIFCKRL